MKDEDADFQGFDLYEDIVNEVVAGRTEGHKCPACGEGDLECRVDEARVLVKCRKCGRFFEGMLA